jgi:hypothetical protein
MAKITPGFSFAFLQECFVATLLILARDEDEELDTARSGNDGLEQYELWRVFKQQADILRKEVEGQRRSPHPESWQAPRQHVLERNEHVHAGCGDEVSHRQAHQTARSGAIYAGGLPDLESLRVKDELLPAGLSIPEGALHQHSSLYVSVVYSAF